LYPCILRHWSGYPAGYCQGMPSAGNPVTMGGGMTIEKVFGIFIAGRFEITVLHPDIVPLFLYRLRIIYLRNVVMVVHNHTSLIQFHYYFELIVCTKLYFNKMTVNSQSFAIKIAGISYCE
jgi:hypothetical protein